MSGLFEDPEVEGINTADSALLTLCPTGKTTGLDVIWFRRSLDICGYLERSRVLSHSDRSLVTFAIMWAPYGGSSSEDLWLAFGLHRVEFLARLGAALKREEAEHKQFQVLKKVLQADLIGAWDSPKCTP